MSDTTLFWWLVWGSVAFCSIIVRAIIRPKFDEPHLPMDMLGVGVMKTVQFIIVVSVLTAVTLFLANTFDIDFVYEFANTSTKSLRTAFGVY